jgi:hypothetical protein
MQLTAVYMKVPEGTSLLLRSFPAPIHRGIRLQKRVRTFEKL